MAGITNAELARQIAELRQLLVSQANEGPAWDGWRHDMELRLTEMSANLSHLTRLVEQAAQHRAETCPYQVEIAQAKENHIALQRLDESITELKVTSARLGIGGGIISLLVVAGVVAGKLLGIL